MLTYSSFKGKSKANPDPSAYLTNYPGELHRKSINQPHNPLPKVPSVPI